MSDNIKFDDAALAAAIAEMQSLRSEHFAAGGSSRLILSGIGDTARAVNDTYAALRQIETALNDLVGVTQAALSVAGVRFPEADTAASGEFSSITAPVMGGR